MVSACDFVYGSHTVERVAEVVRDADGNEVSQGKVQVVPQGKVQVQFPGRAARGPTACAPLGGVRPNDVAPLTVLTPLK